MKLINYCSYFFYLAWNWNPLLAAFVMYHEIRGEKKYNIYTTGSDKLKSLEEKGIDISHATMYQPLNYYVLEKLMEKAAQDIGNKTFTDIGCGKGRVMAVAAYYGFKRITGIDFSKEFCNEARLTTESCKEKFPDTIFTLINNDAFYFDIPRDIMTIFFFNPFDEVIMSGVVSNIMKSLRHAPRAMRILYANPLYKSLFIQQGFTETFHIKKMTYLEGSILEIKVHDLPAIDSKSNRPGRNRIRSSVNGKMKQST